MNNSSYKDMPVVYQYQATAIQNQRLNSERARTDRKEKFSFNHKFEYKSSSR